MSDRGRRGLDRLLELRRRMEEAKTADLVKARKALVDANEAVETLVDHRRALERSVDELEGASVGRVQSLRMVMERVDAGIHNARTVRQAALAEAEERTADFVDAARDREALERVVRSRHEHARQMRQVTEQKLLDEVALVHFRAASRKSP